MKPEKRKHLYCQIALTIAGLFGGAYIGWTANVDIASEPLSTGVSGVKPNIMFVLDDSGSMAWDYLPDHVNDTNPSTNSTTAACFDSGDGNAFSGTDNDDATGSISGRRDACQIGDPPYMSASYNLAYYNPSISYRPAVNADGSAKTVMNAANTSNWTAVLTDGFNVQNSDQLGNNVTTTNLVTGYPDRVWCVSQSDAATSANCLINTAYNYPDAINQYGRDTGGNIKYLFGAPYHYQFQSAQWCADAARAPSDCASGSNIIYGKHIYQAGEFCTDSELTNCTVGSGVTTLHKYSGPRWCSDAATLTTCQRKKIGAFVFPKHAGRTTVATVPVPATSANGSITVTQAANTYQLSTLRVNGVSIIAGAITATGTSTNNLATQIAAAVNSFASSPDYTATVSGSTVTITAVTAGTGTNGFVVAATSTSAGTVGATAQLRIDNSGSNTSRNITAITINGSGNIMSGSCTVSAATFGSGVSASGGTVTASTGTNSGAERSAAANVVRNCINAATGTNGGYTATASGDIVTVSAPVSMGATANGASLGEVGSIPTTGSNFGGGASAGVFTATTNMGGGTAATTATQTVRIGVGLFSRTDIIPTTTSYSKADTRIDCSGTTCTYDEEMTNFANWYSYYRTRMQMMKSAAGRAFVPIDDTYRVGFLTINPTSSGSVSSSKYLKISDYDTTHKANWYTKFYGQSTNSSTPLRDALSRVGQIYAGVFTDLANGIPAADDPIQYSCQPNYTILSTDGYWNGSGVGRKPDGTNMTQQDTVNANYSKRSDGAFDAFGSTVSLSDVALYYYQTDLRTTGTKSDNNVRPVGIDTAPHQHMTTYTIGLGLDGNLTYRKDYASASSGDFFDIKQGTKDWPNPVADSPSALDDLWHAAVNGRGQFFSASNATELADGLTDTLNELKRATGAGAAAATSNLQPVAGDNFAFTAQFATVEWSGDVLARTIDLTSGIVSSVPLWSAKSLLDSRAHTLRQIYTFDAADTAGNRMKHFCFPQAATSWCNDGAGLTLTEQAYFAPSKLVQSGSWTGAQVANATTERVINFLRGDTTYEDTGTSLGTDLFRDRNSILGDIINAQPVYVKSSQFEYTDPGYVDFKKCTEGTTTVSCPAAQFPAPTLPRRPTVFVAANDGMLHAFETDVNNNPYFQTGGIGTTLTSDDTFTGNNAGNGIERWAYIPGLVLPDLYRTANQPYSHRYYTDGSPTAADICISAPCAGVNDWRTIVVAGLNAGKRGYYALDVTNPLAPKALWEFTVRLPSQSACAATPAAAIGATDDCDLGLSYGNPIVTKLSDGRWVVIVSSGHNNTGLEPSTTNRMGDGGGYLYVLNAQTGAIIYKIPTNVGSAGTAGASYTDADPSGLGKLNAWIVSPNNNTALAVYGGDIKGNMWRFDLDPTSSTYLTAVLVANLNISGVPQPITTKIELGLIGTNRVLFAGTGKFLGFSDATTTATQSVYAIRDDLAGNTAVTTRAPLQAQVLTTNTTTQTRSITGNTVDWSIKRGWYVDLPDTGERVNVDPVLQLGTLAVATNVPASNACTAGGTGWLLSFNFQTGSVVNSTLPIAERVSSSLVVGLNIVQLPSGAVKAIVTTSDNSQITKNVPVVPTNYSGQRVTWRELDTTQ